MATVKDNMTYVSTEYRIQGGATSLGARMATVKDNVTYLSTNIQNTMKSIAGYLVRDVEIKRARICGNIACSTLRI